MKTNNDFIDFIKREMLEFYCFDISHENIKTYLKTNPIEVFDTVERDDYANFLAKKITGMEWPMNCDSEEYKKEFYRKLKNGRLV